MSGYTSRNQEKDLEKHTEHRPDELPEQSECESLGNSYEREKRLDSNNPNGDSVSPRSRIGSQTQSHSHRDSTASATSPAKKESFSHPLVKQPTGAGVIIDFDGKDDPYRPMNWPFRKKVTITLLYGFTTCWITFASAIYSSGVQQIAQEFHVSMEVSTAGISMVVFGFGLGPLIWAPLSEVYGRKWAVLPVCQYPVKYIKYIKYLRRLFSLALAPMFSLSPISPISPIPDSATRLTTLPFDNFSLLY